MKKKIFVVTYGGGHANIIAKLYPKLIERFEVVILALTTAEEVLNNANIPYKTLEDYIYDIDQGDNLVEIGKKFINQKKIDYVRLGLKKSSIYYGCCLRDYVTEFGKADLDELYIKQGRMIFLPIKTVEIILKLEKPDAVVTTNSPRFERAAIFASRKLGILNFSIEDLLGNSRNFSIKDPETSYYGDYVFVINNFVKNILTLKNIRAIEVVPIGQPAFEYINELNINTDKVKKDLKIPDGKLVVCWASHESKDEKYIFEELVNIFMNQKDKLLIVKPHPNENIDFMTKVFSNYNTESIIIVDNFDFKTVLSISDVVLTQYSTCGLEAIMSGKPLIVLNPAKRIFAESYNNLKLASEVTDMKKLIENIGMTLNSERVKFEVPSNSSENIAIFIENILKLKK